MTESTPEVTETVEKTETTVEQPELESPAEEHRVEVPEPVETTVTETTETTQGPVSDS